jgi:hypothetical protein
LNEAAAKSFHDEKDRLESSQLQEEIYKGDMLDWNATNFDFSFGLEKIKGCVFIVIDNDCIFSVVQSVYYIEGAQLLDNVFCLPVALTPFFVEVYQLDFYLEGVESANGASDASCFYMSKFLFPVASKLKVSTVNAESNSICFF